MKALSTLLLLIIFVPSVFGGTRTNCKHQTFTTDSLSFKEFQMLHRTLPVKRMVIASFVPGYIHFYAGHRTAGYWIAATRTLGFALSMGGILSTYSSGKQLDLEAFSQADENLILFLTGLFLNAIGYAYDLAHGDYIIEQERIKIQFKLRNAAH